jgi:hypothetical protein
MLPMALTIGCDGRVRPIPSTLTTGVFSRSEALSAGVTARMLDGSRFVRVTPRVWRHRDHEMTDADWWRAAALTLPAEARTTGITRLQQLGLDFGPSRPLHFVIAGDLHLDIDGLFLHRTKLMPPTDGVGVAIEAAYVAYCAGARMIDAIKVGDWLLHGGHMTKGDLRNFAIASPWRPGSAEVLFVLDHLNARARSLKESELRAVLEAVGLPRAEVNVRVDSRGELGFVADLWYPSSRVAVEYEGGQHQEDRVQYNSDIDRYAVFRRLKVGYVQVTKEKLGRPKALVGEVFRELVAAGYTGPPPTFGQSWDRLFMRLTKVVGRRQRLGACRAVG